MNGSTTLSLAAFVDESNRIEGIRGATDAEIEAHEKFLALLEITVPDLVALLRVLAPGNHLRSSFGDNVRVGRYRPPSGGPEILPALKKILADVPASKAFDIHVRYETLHPFSDGNGRTGRALWLWMMRGDAPLGFLHTWYYQSLDARTRRAPAFKESQ